jgi:hypothetical protein
MSSEERQRTIRQHGSRPAEAEKEEAAGEVLERVADRGDLFEPVLSLRQSLRRDGSGGG